MPGWLKFAITIILAIGAVVAGLYVGLWVMFIGGIVQIAEAVKSDPVSGVGIGIGILRMVCASVVGWGVFLLGGFVAWLFASLDS